LGSSRKKSCALSATPPATSGERRHTDARGSRSGSPAARDTTTWAPPSSDATRPFSYGRAPLAGA